MDARPIIRSTPSPRAGLPGVRRFEVKLKPLLLARKPTAETWSRCTRKILRIARIWKRWLARLMLQPWPIIRERNRRIMHGPLCFP